MAEHLCFVLFAHAFPETTGIAGESRGHVAAAQQIQIVVTHFQLQSRQVAEIGSVIACKGVATAIGYPGGETGRVPQFPPPALPVAGNYPEVFR